MANKFNAYLNNFFGQAVEGILKPKGNLGNWQHASRIFVDNTYRLAPRQKFLYYAYFDIDPTSHRATAFTNKHAPEIGLLIKTADLPRYNFDSVVKNQYNRKKIVYKQINYDPVTLTFHDDNQGIINAMWAIYYGTYVADRNLPSAAYSATHLRAASISGIDSFRYGLDNDKTVDFFRSISLYTMSRSRFLGYTLVNPRIKSWQHGSTDYGSSEPIENTMSVEYESVVYSSGTVSVGNPKGFATLAYDNAPSPLSIQGGGVATILGEGGVLGGLESIFGDISKGTTFDSPAGFLSTAIKAVNTYRNIKQVGNVGDALKREAVNILNSPEAIRSAANTVGGIVGTVFPKNTPAADSTTATPKPLINPADLR